MAAAVIPWLREVLMVVDGADKGGAAPLEHTPGSAGMPRSCLLSDPVVPLAAGKKGAPGRENVGEGYRCWFQGE